MNIRSSSVTCLLLFVMAQTGCIALNVPSQRYHDPADGGGVFGAWSRQHGSHGSPQHCIADQNSPGEITCGALEADPFDTSAGPEGKPKPPEVPWPRFHPVPTRPVFGHDHR